MLSARLEITKKKIKQHHPFKRVEKVVALKFLMIRPPALVRKRSEVIFIYMGGLLDTQIRDIFDFNISDIDLLQFLIFFLVILVHSIH